MTEAPSVARRSRIAARLALLCVALVLPATTAAATTLRVGLYDNSPKVYRDGEGQPAGLFVEVLAAIARREDWQLVYVDCEWDDCLTQLQRGELDLMPDVAYTDERGRRFDFHQVAVANSWSTLLVRRDSAIHATPQLAGARIALLRGGVQEAALARMMRGSELRYTALPLASFAEAMQAVADGKAEAVVANSFYAGRHAAAYGLRETAIVFNPAALYFATGRGRHAEVLARIDEHLLAWRGDPDSIYFDAMRHAMAPLPPAPMLPAGLRWLLLALAVVAVTLLLLSATLRWQVGLRTRQLSRSKSQLEHLLAASPSVLYLLDVDGHQLRPRWVSGNIERVFGLPGRPPPLVRKWLARIHEDDRERVRHAFAGLRPGAHIAEEYRIHDGRGRLRHILDEARWIARAGRESDEIVGSWTDLTESREQQARLAYLAEHDSLTGVGNRYALDQALARAIADTGDDRGPALMLLNIDRLHRVNDGFGHDVGDALLRDIARRLQATLGREGSVARPGSDEFAVLLPRRPDNEDLAALGSRLLDAVAQPWRHDGHELTVTASIGIAVHPDDGQSPGELLKSADTALTRAKNSGRNGLQFATAQMNAQIQRWVAIEHHLRQALEAGQFHLHYQPRASLQDGRVRSAEALLRWRSPELGDVPPGDFIPVAEDVGLIVALGDCALRMACAQLRDWRDQGLPAMRVAVNVSAQQLHSGGLPDRVLAMLRDCNLPPSLLEIELTESVMMHDSPTVLAQLAELNRVGIALSLDDFGTGYSSLGYLGRFALDSLKIDQSFVRGLTEDARCVAICNATIGLAHGLGIKVIAEGVETQPQLRYLRAAECDEMQGYLFRRPLTAEDMTAMLREGAGLALPSYR